VSVGSALARWVSALPTSRTARVALGFVVLAFCAAPVPGDVGGCGQGAQQLDAGAFFASKQRIDCERCTECGLKNRTCERVCEGGPVPVEFSEGCIPLVHDGEACLRALLSASCDDTASYVRDQGASTPTECDFCPRRAE
jgi:hypothetical protein